MVSDADVGGVATRAEQWTDFVRDHGIVRPGSSVAADDAACPVLPLSRIAWSCLTFAHTRLLTGGQESVPALRDALIASSHALTVLAPPRRERTTYGLRMAWTVLSGTVDDPALRALAVRHGDVQLREVERLLADRGFAASPRWSALSSVRTAGAWVSAGTDDPETFEAAVRALWRGTAEADAGGAGERAVAGIWERAAEKWRLRTAAPVLPPRSHFAGRARFGAAPDVV